MHRGPSISVITPVYNCLPYLHDTVASVYHQTLPREAIEMVVVDDGSTDGSSEVLESWASRWPQLTLIKQEPSGGPSRPRNVGIEAAAGEYLFFLDGDDALAPRALEVLLQAARRNDSDVVLGKLAGVGRKTQVSVFAKDVDRAPLPLAWSSLTASKLIRRSLVLANDIRFPEHMRIREDGHFVARCYLASTVISIVGSYVCHYAVRRRDGSSLTSEELSYDTVLRQGDEGIELLRERVAEQKLRDRLTVHFIERDLLHAFRTRFLAMSLAEQQAAMATAAGYADRWVTEGALRHLPLPDRLRVFAIRLGSTQCMAELIAWERAGAHVRTALRGGRWYADAPILRRLPDVPEQLLEQAPPGLTAHVDLCEWRSTTLVIRGHAYLEGVTSAETSLRIALRRRGGADEAVVARSQPLPSPHVNAVAGGGVADYSTSGFQAELDLQSVLERRRPAGPWRLELTATHGPFEAQTLLGRSRAGDALPAVPAVTQRLGGRTFDATIEVAPKGHLRLVVRRR